MTVFLCHPGARGRRMSVADERSSLSPFVLSNTPHEFPTSESTEVPMSPRFGTLRVEGLPRRQQAGTPGVQGTRRSGVLGRFARFSASTAEPLRIGAAKTPSGLRANPSKPLLPSAPTLYPPPFPRRSLP